MTWIFVAFLVASVLHMGEEYFYPGGFMELMKRFNPRFAPLVTVPAAIVLNGLQLLLCVVAIGAGARAPTFGMSVAALLCVNALVHVAACFRKRGYAPGVISGVLVYLPLPAYAYCLFFGSGRLTWSGIMLSGALGLLYQSVPIGYFALASARRGRSAAS